MAFQESELNPNKKSGRGAVGLMQIKPSTASDPNVGIDDIGTVDNNVHAAVKYLAFIRNQYFNDDNIRPRDKVRLSLAAYNAGAGQNPRGDAKGPGNGSGSRQMVPQCRAGRPADSGAGNSPLCEQHQ